MAETKGTDMFKKALLSLAAVTALSAAAVPAMAQDHRGGHDRYDDRRDHDRGDRDDRRGDRDNDREYGRGWDNGWDRIDRRFQRLDHRIDQGVRNGQISRREAVSLRAQFQQLIQLERRYSRGGLSRAERQDLENRFDRLQRQIRYERRDRDGRRW